MIYRLPPCRDNSVDLGPGTRLAFHRIRQSEAPLLARSTIMRESNRGLNASHGEGRCTIYCQWPPARGQPQEVGNVSLLDSPSLDDNVAVSPDGRLGVLTDRQHSAIYLRCLFTYVNPVHPIARRFQAAPALTDAIPIGLDVGTILAVAVAPFGIAAAGPDGRVAYARINGGNAIDPNDVIVGERRILRGHKGRTLGLAFSPDGTRLVAVGHTDVTIWDLTAPQEIKTILDLIPDQQKPRGTLEALTEKRPFLASADGRWACYFHGAAWNAPVKFDPWIEVVDTSRPEASPCRVASPDGLQGTVWAISPDGSLVASSGSVLSPGHDMRLGVPIHLLSTVPGGKARTLNGPALPAMSLMFDREGKRLLSPIAGEAFVRLWDVEKGEEAGRYEPLTGKVGRAEFSPDYRWVISGDSSGTITVWLTDIRKVVKTFRFGIESRRTEISGGSAIWTTFGNLLAVPEDRRIVIWNMDTGESVGEVIDLGQPVDELAFLSDGTRLVSASGGRLRLWSVETGHEVLSLPLGSAGNTPFRTIVERLNLLQERWKASVK